MKKLLLLFSILPFLARGQAVTGTVDLSNYPTRSEVEKMILDAVGAKPPVKPVNPPCPFAPSINTVGPVTNKSVTFNFYGQDVYKLTAAITYGQDTVWKRTVRPTSDRPTIMFNTSFPEGRYYLHIKGDSCQSDVWSSKEFAISGSSGGTDPPPIIAPSDIKGAYFVDYGTHTASYTGSVGLKLSFKDGKVSDATPGLTFDGVSNVINGKRRYYLFGGWYFEKEGKYDPFRNVELPTSLISIQAYDCDPAQVPTYEEFKKQLGTWNSYINTRGGEWSFVTLRVKNKTREPYIVVPDWIEASFTMNWARYAKDKDWKNYGKYIANEVSERGVSRDVYIAKGVNGGMSGPNAFSTEIYKTSQLEESKMKEVMLLLGRATMGRMSGSTRAILTSQFVEDNGSWISKYTPYYYQGAFNALKDKGATNPRQTGLYGEYGAEEVVSTYTLYGHGRPVFEESLTSKVKFSYKIDGRGWQEMDTYYSSGSFKFRGLNKKNYFGTGLQDGAYSSLYYGERAQIGMYDQGGVNVIFYTMPIFEADRPFTTTGTIIPFPNGELVTRTGEYHQSCWDEQFIHSYFNTLINAGVAQWYSPGMTIGSDPNQIQIGYPSTDRTNWIPRGGTSQTYVSGKDGAPVNSLDGLYNRNISSSIDASMAAVDVLWDVKDKFQNVELVTYQSTRGGYTVKGGTAGGILNGRSVLNQKFFDVYDLVDQQKGIALYCYGSAGTFLVYYNGFLSVHESEVVTIMGKTFKANGRQIYQIPL